jgi:hypothetical protein
LVEVSEIACGSGSYKHKNKSAQIKCVKNPAVELFSTEADSRIDYSIMPGGIQGGEGEFD